MAARDELTSNHRSDFEGKLRAYAKGSKRVPPPWVIAFKPSRSAGDTLAEFVALHVVRPSKAAEHEEPWLVRGVLRRADSGPPILGRLTVEHYSNPGIEVTGHVLRGLPLGVLRRKALEWLRPQSSIKEVLGATPAEKRWANRVTAEAKKQPLKRGRKGYPDDHYRRIALRAIQLFDAGIRDVTRVLAKEEKRPYQTVRDWIAGARKEKRGFLAPVKQGRTDFRPGPNLYRNEASDD